MESLGKLEAAVQPTSTALWTMDSMDGRAHGTHRPRRDDLRLYCSSSFYRMSFSSAAATLGESLARSPALAPAGEGDAKGRHALPGTATDTCALIAVATIASMAAAHRSGAGYVDALFLLAAAGRDTGTTLRRPRFRARHGLLCSWQSTRFVVNPASSPACPAGDVCKAGFGAMGRNLAMISLAFVKHNRYQPLLFHRTPRVIRHACTCVCLCLRTSISWPESSAQYAPACATTSTWIVRVLCLACTCECHCMRMTS